MLNTDLLIVGASVGGCACALAACQAGLKVILSEECDWIGGQFTSQATPPDEHGWIEEFGCTRTYREFREKVRQYYREHYPLTLEAHANPLLNPGNGWVSPLCAEPKVFLAVLQEMLAPFVSSGQLTILLNHRAMTAQYDDKKVYSITLQNEAAETLEVKARYFVDATETGELLPLTQTAWVSGAESRLETGEPSAPLLADPHNNQAFSMCFALSYHEGQDHTIAKPQDYEFWCDFVPNLNPAWAGPLLRLTGLSPRTMQPVHYNFQPNKEPNIAFAGLWTYRRIRHLENFKPGAFDSDITLVNYPQIDYMLGDLLNASFEQQNQYIQAAKNQSLSFLYYLQTELGFKGLRLCPEITGTADGLSKRPYIRESRRIKALVTITEQQVAAARRPGKILAECFHDSVGIGFYRIDLHPSTGGDNYVDVECLPFQIPLGALLPQKMGNLLPACKNIGTTHITNGCYRLHPIEWNIGEVVGNLIAYCMEKSLKPVEVHQNTSHLQHFQDHLRANGLELEWPKGLDLKDGDPHRHAL
jgi:hypothetical protein